MKARILIAEDSTYMRMLLKELLIRSGYDVIGEADNGNDAVRLYDKYKPDIAAIDMLMPEMNGIDVLKTIRASHPDARLLMISAMGQEKMVIEAMKAGASDFFIKPLQSERVIEAIERAMRH